MYTVHTFDEIRNNPELKERYNNYKLCFMDSINPMISDYTEESKKIMASGDFSWEVYGYNKPRGYMIRMEDVPNPEFVINEKEYYAYFTPLTVDEQWGDDWNDAPYEHNCGTPYDDYYPSDDLNAKRQEADILMVPFAVKSYNARFPKDWGGANSPFSVDDINRGAIAWLFDTCRNKKHRISVSIMAQESIDSVEQKLLQIAENNKDFWEPRTMEDIEMY